MHANFGQKLLSTQGSVSGCTRKSPIMKWANALKKSSKKNSLKPNPVSHNTTSRYTDTDGFLEHSSSGGSLYYKGPTLQKIIPDFFRVPLVLLSEAQPGSLAFSWMLWFCLWRQQGSTAQGSLTLNMLVVLRHFQQVRTDELHSLIDSLSKCFFEALLCARHCCGR